MKIILVLISSQMIKQILIDFMKYLILLSLNEFNIEYFDEEFYPI